MTMQKLPVLGTFFKFQVPVAGQTGPNYSTGVITAPAACEVTISRFKLSGAAITLDGTTATVTLAAHLNTKVGQQVTFSGVTGSGADQLNDQTWTISQIVSSSVYKFPCILTGTAAGTIVQEPVFTLPQGFGIVRCDANLVVDYCSDNLYISPSGSATKPVWKVLYTGNATPVIGTYISDGFSVRLRCSGTTASSYFNVVA